MPEFRIGLLGHGTVGSSFARLVDERADGHVQTVERAVQWCNQHLALPANAMSRTREIIRSDLVSIYDDLGDADRVRAGLDLGPAPAHPPVPGAP